MISNNDDMKIELDIYQTKIIDLIKNQLLNKNNKINYIFDINQENNKKSLINILNKYSEFSDLNIIDISYLSNYKLLSKELYKHTKIINKKDKFIIFINLLLLNQDNLDQIYSSIEHVNNGIYTESKYKIINKSIINNG
jgi:hypothetical protein